MIGVQKLKRMRLVFDLLPRPGESVALELYDEILEMRKLLEKTTGALEQYIKFVDGTKILNEAGQAYEAAREFLDA